MVGLEGMTLDRYELQQIIGRGGMADVYRAYDPHFERDVAVKVFKRQDEEMLRRFIREARLMASLRNDHLMPIYDTGNASVDGVLYYYIVMPIMEGGTLRARIRQSPLTLAEASRYLNDIASALDYIHTQGIIHRDMKSSNVLLNADGHSYLSDFGIAHTTSDATQLTSVGNVLGTVDYVAPELFEPHHTADTLSDQYSLGVLLYEMVTGHLPFSADNQIAIVTMHVSKRPPAPHTFVPDIPPQVEQVMLRVLEKKPALRYRNATELALAFYRAVNAPPRTPDVYEDIVVTTRSEVRPTKPLVLPTPRVASRETRVLPATRASRANPSMMPDQRSQAYPVPVVEPKKYPPPHRRRTDIVVVLALLVLLAVIGPLIYVAIARPFGSTTTVTPIATTGNTITATAGPDLTATTTSIGATATAQAATAGKATATAQVVATATVQAKATATAQVVANATATAVVAPTATVQAQASATAGVIQTVTAGAASYTDPLTDANNPTTLKAKWDPDTVNCVFKTDGYHVIQKASALSDGLKGCIETGYNYANMAASVDVTIISGSSGGIFFRTSNQGIGGTYAGYLFEVDSQGRYRISRSTNFSLPLMTIVLQDWTAAPALNAGLNIKNTLQLWVNGGSFEFYANNIFLKGIQDTTYLTGNIAFLATTAKGGTDADVSYLNLQAFQK